MKNKLLFIIPFIIIALALVLFKNKDENYKTIRVAEVTHSAFYAPLYVALHKGYFKEEGLNIELSMISGANNVASAVLSGDTDIGFCGPEASIYVYNGGEKDYLISFAGLTKRDGQFIVSREKQTDFSFDKLKGKEILAGRIAGMPELNFENALKNTNVNKNDVTINTSVDFANLTSAFISGTGDYVNLFEPNATKLEKEGLGYIVASVGEKSGEMPYTAFNAKKSYIDNNKDIIKKFTNAINKGLIYTKNNNAQVISNDIRDEFPDIALNDLIKIVDRYKKADTWLDSSFIEEKMFNNLEDIMINSNQIKKYVPYNKLVKYYK